MIEIITKDIVKEKVVSAENILNECFEMLLDFKHNRGDLGNILANFQPKLAECLYNLMQFYHELQQEKKKLIAQKEKYNKQEFSTIMSDNASFSKVVSKTIEIGKNLGDAYVWFFFRDNRPELDKHFNHEPTGLYVGGIGGLGELEFIKHTPTLNGLYVLYHSITTMLRIGDFSLYDGNHGIVGVGELKTKQNGDFLNITANITSRLDVFPYAVTEIKGQSPNSSKKIKEMEKDFPTLKKQLETHNELLKIKDPEHSSALYASYEYDLINTISPDNPITVNSDNSLLLLGSWNKGNNLFECLYAEETDYKVPSSFHEKVLLLTKQPSPYDKIILGQLIPKTHLLSIPVFWWNINDSICKDLYFSKVDIATVFNPAKLLKYYLDDGFIVSAPGGLKTFEISKEINGCRIGVHHFESICYLITNNLMKTSDVYAFSCKVTDAIASGKIASNTKIDMIIHLDSFGKPNLKGDIEN